MEAIQSIGGMVFGFWFYKIFSNPFHLKGKLPKVTLFKIIELLPNLKIRIKKNILHVHHWMFLTTVLTLLFINTSTFTHLLLLKSFCLGGILQGFTFKDRFNIFYKS